MHTDPQGHPLSGATPAAVDAYSHAIRAFNTYRGDPIALLDSAVAEAPELVMARIAKAAMFALSTEPEATREAQGIIRDARSLPTDDRERSFAAAVALLANGNWPGASRATSRHSMDWPRDLLALQVGHLIDFYCADSRNLRERIARALPDWDAEVPGHSFVLGMYAFGLEEAGDYRRAEDTGREAVAREPYDAWAHHAVAHVMEMETRPEDGIGWMIAREPFWSEAQNVFKVHNWWHRAVYHLDLGQTGDALALYDGPIRGEQSRVALDLVDASALLWRLHLAGADADDRWQELADAWAVHADGQTYPFNDWHAAMAFLGAGRSAEVETLIDRMRSSAGTSPVGDWIGRIGVPLVEGFTAFHRGDHDAAVDKLMDVRRFAGVFGGSHAQRDIIDLTLIEAAIRAGSRSVAHALANERIEIRPTSRMSRRFLKAAAGPDDQ